MKRFFLFIAFMFSLQAVSASPEIQHWTTNKGIKVYFVAAPELPMVDVQLVFDAGGARDNGKPGVAMLTAALLEEGAGGLSAQAISERFEGVGASFGAGSYRDMAVLSLRTLTEMEWQRTALETMAVVAGRPDFDAKSFERERKQMLLGLKAKKQSPGAIAEETFMRALYGDHPYGQPTDGTEASLNAMTRQDVVDFYNRYYVASNAIVAIVGAVDRAGAEAIANALEKPLKTGVPADPLPAVVPLTSGRVIRVAYPSSQTHILMGQPAIARGDPDHFSLHVGNHILGGSGLVSRLSNEIREKRGLSYSTHSYFSPMRMAGPFEIGLETRNDAVDEALKVMNETLNTFIDKGPERKEVEAAKRNITGGFPLSVASNKSIVQYIAMIGFYGLPLDYLDKFNASIDAEGMNDIRKAFINRLQPDKMVTVIVGGDK